MADIKAVLHLRSKTDHKNIMDLGARVISGLSNNTDVYASPSPTVAELQTRYDALATKANTALNGTHTDIVARNEEAAKLYNLLKDEVLYVNKIAINNEAVLLRSGFDTNKEVSKPSIPVKVIIKNITAGSEEHSAKIAIENVSNARNYRIQTNNVSSTSTDWILTNFATSSFQLYVSELTRGQEIWIRVSAGNTSGWGEWSDPVSFISK